MPFLDWVNKAQAQRVVADVPYHLLQFQSAHGDAAAENLLIQGDNLLALKALLPFYRGRVKCIYIDPPYNTQSAFEHYDDKLEHSQWLSMMWPSTAHGVKSCNQASSGWVARVGRAAIRCAIESASRKQCGCPFIFSPNASIAWTRAAPPPAAAPAWDWPSSNTYCCAMVVAWISTEAGRGSVFRALFPRERGDSSH